MARLKNGIDFIGRLGGVTAYRMKGCKYTILRTHGGPSAERIKHDPNFKTVRLNGDEFGARAKAAAVFTRILRPLKSLADYNYAGAISSRMKVVQDLDTEHALGQRSILFSRHPDLWEGFTLNTVHGFDSLVFAPLSCTISRETLSAKVEIPALVSTVNLALPDTQSLFRIQAVLGLLPDFTYQPSRNGYVSSVPKERIAAVQEATPWTPCVSRSPATSLELALPPVLVEGGFALMVSVGICFGKPIGGNGDILQLDQAGAAKILAVA